MTGLFVAIALMLIMLLGGFWIAIAIGLSGFVALYFSVGFTKTVNIFGSQIWGTSTEFVMTALPLFVLMGEMLYYSGILQKIYDPLARLCRRLPGGLLQTNIAMSTFFAACSGSSLASAATIGHIAYPNMVKLGYEKRMLLGSIAAGGTLGILIPPSTILILYGALSGASIGKLFLAGVIPGVVLALAFSIYIALYAWFRPEAVPKVADDNNGGGWLSIFKGLWQIILLIVVIFWGLYGGVATPTEIASFGSFLTLLFVLFSGKGRWTALFKALRATVRTTSMIMFIVIGAKMLSVALAYYSVPPMLQKWFISFDLSPLGYLFVILLFYLILGMFFDGLSMIVVTLPFVLPIVHAAGIDLIWFGILVTIVIEVGLLTPPVGMNLFVLQSVTKERLSLIVRGSFPFVIVLIFVLLLIVLVPEIALWLPDNVGK